MGNLCSSDPGTASAAAAAPASSARPNEGEPPSTERKGQAPPDSDREQILVPMEDGVRMISMQELSRHTVRGDLWMAVYGDVYDVSDYAPTHPGGDFFLLQYGGKVADEAYDSISGHTPEALLDGFPPPKKLGRLEGSKPTVQPQTQHTPTPPMTQDHRAVKSSVVRPRPRTPSPSAPRSRRTPSSAMPQSLAVEADDATPAHYLTGAKGEMQQAVLVSRTQISEHTVRCRFELPDPTAILGLPPGQHMLIAAPNARGVNAGDWNGAPDKEYAKGLHADVFRKMAPATFRVDSEEQRDDDELSAPVGYFELSVRLFDRTQGHCDGGKLSQYLCEGLPLGAMLSFKGPRGPHEYIGMGSISTTAAEQPLVATSMGIIAGSTGMPPLLNIVVAALHDSTDKTRFALVCAAETDEEILYKDTLTSLARRFPDQIAVAFMIGDPATVVTGDELRKHLPPPDEDPLLLLCGPGPKLAEAWRRQLAELAYASSRQLLF
jgi:cytochrome-b5 reductase